MTELTISASEITDALRKHVTEFDPAVGAEQVGRVVEVGDGIARVSGLPGAKVNELLEFEDGTLGLAMNLDEETIGAVVLGSVDSIEEEQIVRATGRILSMPVGDALLGRVVNALGEPIDGKGPLEKPKSRRMEVQAPGIIGRQPVSEPLQTGIKAIDAMTPIGRGQRELIIGDRKTGKTTVVIDTILNQKGQNVKCIYVAIGQKNSSVAQTVKTLDDFGALEYTVVVVASAGDPAPFKFLAPYAGCAIGQEWMEGGEHALVVYDDLVSGRDRREGRWTGGGYGECAAVADLAHKGILRPVQLRLVCIWGSWAVPGLGDAGHVSGAVDRVDGDSSALIRSAAA